MDQPIESWPLSALLRGARAALGSAMRQALARAGCDDLPPNGPFVLGAIARTSAPLSSIIPQLGVSKQAAGQLVDTLVLRGYLERSVDPADRRRLVVGLTPRGEDAAALIRAAVDQVEAHLEADVGSERMRATREVLASLIRPALARA
jgi:DNA-binding MarR family transcriptional regulator